MKERRAHIKWLYEASLKKKKTKLHFDIDKVIRKRDYDHYHAGEESSGKAQRAGAMGVKK